MQSERKHALNEWVDLLALGAGVTVFATGLVLLARFHIGEDSLNASGLGLSRLAWVNLHRFAGVVMFAAAALHAQLHWRAIVVRVSRARKRLPGRATTADLILYFGFGIAPLTAAVAWFLVPGSPPLFGPVEPGHLAPSRHIWIDLHFVSSFVLLPAAVIHTRRHWNWILRVLRLTKGDRHGSQQRNLRRARSHVVERSGGV